MHTLNTLSGILEEYNDKNVESSTSLTRDAFKSAGIKLFFRDVLLFFAFEVKRKNKSLSNEKHQNASTTSINTKDNKPNAPTDKKINVTTDPWEKHTSRTSGKTYWYNTLTKKSH